MEVWRPFQYRALWMSKRHIVTLHDVISVYNDMFDHVDGVMWALAKKKTQWREDLYFAVKFAQQKLSIHHPEVTAKTGLLPISAHIIDPFQNWRSFRKWEKGMHINPDDESSYTTQYQKAFLKYVENEYCTIHRRLSVNTPKRVASNNPFSTMACGSGQSSFDPDDLSSDDDEYIMPNNVGEMAPGHSDRVAR